MIGNPRPIKSFTDLYAWREGHGLVMMVYKVTASFPKPELYGLVSQLRRSAVSITSNIAEGFGRRSYREKVRFYTIALGSLIELQNQSIIAKDVGFIKVATFDTIDAQTTKVRKLIIGLVKSSKSRYS